MLSFKNSFLLTLVLIVVITTSVNANTKALNPTVIPNYTQTKNLTTWRAKLATYNVWGLMLFSKFKNDRMPKIGEALREQDLDYALLQEAWTTRSRQEIYSSAGLPFITYSDVNNTVGSGLFSLSKHPYKRHTFMPFTLNGGFGRLWEGEVFAGKGVSMATLDINGLPISFFNLHTVARHGLTATDAIEDRYTPERLAQLFEIFQHIVENVDSDAFVVAGDFNMRWFHTEYKFWKTLTSLSGNTLEEFDKTTCTSCKDNMFNINPSGQVDYVFVSPKLKIIENKLSYTERFVNKLGVSLNLSDHYGWVSKIAMNSSKNEFNSVVAKQNTMDALNFLELRLYRYLNKKGSLDDEDFPDPFNGIQDRICISCRVRDCIRKVNIYQKVLTPDAQLTVNQKALKLRLESYFKLFD
ncbi:MAG: endonuclease/exonuclease/phosphatase family protein [Oligoflexia bacterium]|nr:endonuclease/exonuclease/phosphatase family protein [Oligoflexia bacterium]